MCGVGVTSCVMRVLEVSTLVREEQGRRWERPESVRPRHPEMSRLASCSLLEASPRPWAQGHHGGQWHGAVWLVLVLVMIGVMSHQHGQAAVRHLPAVGEGELAQLEGNRGEEGTTAGTGVGEAGTCGRYWVMYLRATSDTSVLPRLNFLRPFSLDFLSIRPGGGVNNHGI